MHTSTAVALTTDWDLDFDANGDLKVLDGVDAICQAVSQECRLFWHDAYFRYEDGIKWFTDQLGRPVQEAVIRDRIRQAAMSVPGVLESEVTITELDGETRTLHGQVSISTEFGNGISEF